MKLLEYIKSVRAVFARRKGIRENTVPVPSDVGFVAYRLSRGDGWDVRAIQQSYDTTVAEIRSEIGHGAEVRWIVGGRDADAIGDYELGWMRDVDADCWRAPGELITQPRTPSTRVPKITITFKPPDAGWIVLGIDAGDQNTEIWSTYFEDPFPDLVAVLENLSKGIGGRVTIDTEGAYRNLHCYALEPDDHVRLIVTDEPSYTVGYERDVIIDVTTDRSGFVRSVYSSMVQYFTSEAFLQNKQQWASDDPEIGFHAADFSEFRSDLLDKMFGLNDRSP